MISFLAMFRKFFENFIAALFMFFVASTQGRSGGVPGNANASTTRSTISHQSSITSQVDVVEDRKALRDALYQVDRTYTSR